MAMATRKPTKRRRSLKVYLRIARRALLSHHQPPKTRAFTIALGVFLAFTPLYGFQTLVGLALAFLLRLNKILVVVLVNLVTPYPAVPFIMYASHSIGSWLVTSNGLSDGAAGENLTQYFTGGFLLAAVMGSLAGLVSYPLFIHSRKKNLAK